MGVTKQYLRYTDCGVFNVIASSRANIAYLPYKDIKGKYCVVAACENVIVWDTKKNEKACMLYGDKHEVTSVCPAIHGQSLAVGYANGSISIYEMASGKTTVTFNGHKRAVNCMNYDKEGMRLVSGSMDTEIVVWDIVNESGLFRLRGHKGEVTQARFMADENLLITSSKDTFIKLWDLDTQHCFKTLAGHRTELWDFQLICNDRILVTGSGDSELRCWELTKSNTPRVIPRKKIKLEKLTSDDSDSELDQEDDSDDEEGSIVHCTKLGSIMREGRDRVVSLTSDKTGKVLACHGNDKVVELFRINSLSQQKSTAAKRWKKLKKQRTENNKDPDLLEKSFQAEDFLFPISKPKMSGKVRAVDMYLASPDSIKLLCLLTNNSIQSCFLPVDSASAPTTISKLDRLGHRSTVRSVAFSSDNTAIVSASAETVKVWKRSSLTYLRHMPSDYALCCVFAPGDRHVIIGTKSGSLQIFELPTGTLLETINAHSKSLWAIAIHPNQKSIATGGGDRMLHFWDYELVDSTEEANTSKRLTLVKTRTMEVDEEIDYVRYSPNGKYIAAALMDNTVKVFFADTLKFFLSLYGHKLPALCLDICTDSTLIATGSSDRSVKIWGMDFGDCHKSLFAHDDSVMCLQFIPKTHMFFSGGKDYKLKQWDADNFQHILTIDSHHGAISSLAISSGGNFVVSASHDKTLRLWERTDEILVISEEKEMEREKEYEESMENTDNPVLVGEANDEVGIAGRQTVETVKSAEKIMEALELHKLEAHKLAVHKDQCLTNKKEVTPLPKHPMLVAFNCDTPDLYVMEVLKKVKSSELEESLMVLPFSYIPDLLKLLNKFIESGWNIELSCRCLFFLLRIHQSHITSNNMLLSEIDKLRKSTIAAVTAVKDTFGFNLAGLKFMKRQFEEKEEVMFFTDASDRQREKRKKKKQRAVLSFKT